MARRLGLTGAALIAIALLAVPVRREVHGLTLVVRAAALQGVARRVADIDTVPIREHVMALRFRRVSHAIWRIGCAHGFRFGCS